jgi:hypothetical protein
VPELVAVDTLGVGSRLFPQKDAGVHVRLHQRPRSQIGSSIARAAVLQARLIAALLSARVLDRWLRSIAARCNGGATTARLSGSAAERSLDDGLQG